MKQIDLFDNAISETQELNFNKNNFESSEIDFENSLKMVRGTELDIYDDSKNGYLTGSYEFYPNEAWVQTYSGRRFTPLKPMINSIVIQDIAQGLSNICRYNGQLSEFYSVAQHSVIVSYFCDEKDALHGLLHDSSEAQSLGDLPSPVKKLKEFSEYRKAEKRIMDAVYARFGLSTIEPISVKQADMLALATEAKSFFNARADWKINIDPAPFHIIPLNPKEAKKIFLNRFFDLIKRPDIKNKYSSSMDKLSNSEIERLLK